MADNIKIINFLTLKKFNGTKGEKDLREAIKLGEQLMLERIESLMIGMNVNGTLQLVLTEQKLKEIMNE